MNDKNVFVSNTNITVWPQSGAYKERSTAVYPNINSAAVRSQMLPY